MLVDAGWTKLPMSVGHLRRPKLPCSSYAFVHLSFPVPPGSNLTRDAASQESPKQGRQPLRSVPERTKPVSRLGLVPYAFGPGVGLGSKWRSLPWYPNSANPVMAMRPE